MKLKMLKIYNKLNFLFFESDNIKGHLKFLDGLRGIAVLFVILAHSSNNNIMIHEKFNFYKSGKIGVYLFFCLSAFLISNQIIYSFNQNKVNFYFWKRYFFRRFLRIYPLFFIALVSFYLLNLAGINTKIVDFTDIVNHLILLKGDEIFWSIPVEFKFYILLPAVLFFCHKYLCWKRLNLVLFFVFFLVIIILINKNFDLNIISTIKYLSFFIVGIIFSIYDFFKKDRGISFKYLGLLSFLLIVLSIPHFFHYLFGFLGYNPINFRSTDFFIIYSFLWGFVIMASKEEKSILNYFLKIRLLRFIGKISYSVYLFHLIPLYIVMQLKLSGSLKFFIFLMSTFIISSLSFLLIEKTLKNINKFNRI